MSKRLNKEREATLQPKRMSDAIESIEAFGFKILYQDDTKITFEFKYNLITYFPYSGWASGKTIKDGRGLQNLLNQIKKASP